MTHDTPNETSFNYLDAPDGRRIDGYTSYADHYKNLMLLNSQLYNGWKEENKEHLHRQDNLHVFDAVASDLELTSFQARCARDEFDSLSLGTLGNPVEMVALVVCAAVCRRDGRIYHPQRGDSSNDALFTEVVDDHGFRANPLTSCFNRVGACL